MTIGCLILCGTPIGHLGDISTRLADTLAQADAILAEDTRRTRVLLQHLGVRTRPESYFVGNESTRAGRLERLLRNGSTVALVSDAGMPTVADPGLSAVRAAKRVGARISVIPGPSAVPAALAVSGLPGDRFVFEGFIPRRGIERSRRLEELAAEARTIVLFSAPSRLTDDLEALMSALGPDRPITLARELTKLHEEIWSGTLARAAEEWTDRRPLGEFTLVVGGWTGSATPMDTALGEVAERRAGGQTMSDAVRKVADGLGIGRRALYEAVLRSRPD